MKIKTKPFLSSLDLVGRAIKDKTTLPILSHVWLGSDSSVLTLKGSSLEVFMQSRVDCDGELPPVCVKHAALVEIVRRAESDALDLSMTEGGMMLVKAGKSVFRLHTLPADGFPADPATGPSIAAPAKALSNGLRATAWAVISPKSGRPPLENVIVDLGAARLRCYAGNGYVLASYQEGCICTDQILTVPGVHALKMADALLCEGAFLWVTPSHVGVETKFSQLAIQRSEHPVPAFEQVISEMEKPGLNALLSLEKLKALCSKASLLSDNKAEIPRIKITISNGLVELVGSGNNGDLEDSFEWVGDCSTTIHLNADYLLSALRHLQGDNVTVQGGTRLSVWGDGSLTIGMAQLKA